MLLLLLFFFFFNDTATTEIYTLSLHDALPISCCSLKNMSGSFPGHPLPIWRLLVFVLARGFPTSASGWETPGQDRSEEHTSELQSHLNLVCRLLLEKKKYRQNALNTFQQLVHV